MLKAQSPNDSFWQTRNGGVEARDAVKNANIPILLTTGYNDFYVGGVFSMWNEMDEATKEKSALIVSPYNHGDGWDKEKGLVFPDGQRRQAFGAEYAVAWFDHIRTGAPLPFAKGRITYYRAFENRWAENFYDEPTTPLTVPLCGGTQRFTYNPQNPPAFRPEGLFAEDFEDRKDVLRVKTPPFDKDVFVKGRMGLKLRVQSDCPDTSFYARISIKKAEYAYVLRHDITSLCHQLGDYEVGQKVELGFTFDEYAFLIEKGDCLWIDISATDENTYVCHTNTKGAYALQEKTAVANNVVYLDKSCLILPVETGKEEP
jgi:predicted acyl esterase